MKPNRHHIRRWSQSAREAKTGLKVQTFVWTCTPCGARGETTSKTKRDQQVEDHQKQPRS